MTPRPKVRAEAKVTVSGECFVYVEGISINCPLCGVIVRSGDRHSCMALRQESLHQKRLRRKR